MEPQSHYAHYQNSNKRTTSSNINANYPHHNDRNHLNPKRSFKQRPVHKNSVQSIDTNTSFIDSITWPIAPLSYRNINDPKYSKEYDDNTQHTEGKTEQSDDSLLSSVDTNELLASPNRLQQLDNRNIIIHQAPNNKSEASHKQSSGSYHYVETLNTSRSHKLSFDFDEELPALPTSHNGTKSKKSKHKQGNYKKKTTNNSKKKVNVPAVSSYFSNKYYDSMHMDRHHMYSNYNYTPTSRSVPSSYSYSYSGDNITRKLKNNNVVLPLVSIKSSPKTKTRQKHNNLKNNSQMQVPGNSKRIKRKSMPQTQTQNKSRSLTKKSNKKRKNGNVLHPHSRIPIATIPAIPNNINDKNTKSISCVTYDFDCDSDPIPKPASYRNMHSGNVNKNKIKQNQSVVNNLELTKENLERLNANNLNNMYNVTDSTSSDGSDGSDQLHKLEKIGKQLREISILAAAAQDCSSGDNSSMMVQANLNTAAAKKPAKNSNYLVTVTHCTDEKEASDDYDNSVNLSSTDFESHNLDDLSPKYHLQATPSTQPDDSIAISSTKYDAKSVNNRRVLPVQSQHLKHVYYKSKRRRKLRNKMKSKQNRKYNDLPLQPQQPYINDDGDTYTDHTFSVLLNDVLNDDIISHPNGSGMDDINHIQVYDEEEKKLQLTLKSTNRTSNTVTYADSIELEQKLNFIHANQRSEKADICLYNELEASNRSRSIGVRQLALDLNLQSKKAQHLSAVNDLNHLRQGSDCSNSTIPSLLIPIDQHSDDENECLQLCPTNSPQQHQRQHIRYIHDNDDIHEEEAQANEQKEAEAKGYKLAFSLRENSCLCFNIWLIMFHIISIMSYLSQSYIGFIHYKLKGIITYQLICYVCLSVIIFSIYIRMLMKNISFKDYKYLNDGRNNKLIGPSMINCTHFMLQFVIYMLLIVIDGNGMHGWAIIVNNFDMGQVFLLVTIIIFQCICLSMTVINILSYLWEKKHYHRQSLSFRVLCLYLDIVRILVLIYVFWNLSDDNNYNIISSFYYLYFYVEYWLLLILLITVRYILICVNFNSFYRIFGSTSFLLYCTYCLIEPIFRFIIIQLFPHCAVYYMIHNVGTGKFDHYLSKNQNSFLFCTVQIPSIKKIICADIMIGNSCNSIQIPSVSKHFALLAIFEFIENGVYEYIENDGFLLSKDVKQEMFRRILTVNYQLLMNDTTICGATELYNTNHERLLNLNNIILYEFHKMSQLSMYPLKILRKRNDLYMDNDSNFNINGNPSPKMYDDLFQNKDISKSNIFMEWFINNDLMANLHFEWSNDFTVNHPLFTTFICKYIVTLFYIFTRITNICWLYFMINNYILYLFNTQIDNNTKWILIYICAVIIVLHIFAHIVLIIIAIKAYDFERTIWFLLPMLNAKYIDKLLDAAADVKNIVDVYESFCYKHIVSNNIYNNLGYDIGVVIMSYLGHDLSYDTYNLNEKNDDTVIITTDLKANVVDI